ncbi:Pyridine nucleotide-disulphide oxidoreductase [Actinacidiphila yanglinensis]|uniref:Pyridine nucleotide-disulphide oxidoreductase n=1 Tax=Actinacidiphila yanglinensis TaxID=310779 RepID=A0A1H6CW68_9ACTN|nr:NAD(P)-binding domain-containing protein [Actinacidiphila yanglinensis]SEG76953.1 Pyridine nucleotide-disulphide oxidoreductase [Actinacidiphila yanglinensis]
MSGDERIDYLVVGAGPAGVQAGYFLERAGRDYLVVEAGPAPGTFFTRFPRHRTMISSNKVHTGWDDPELRLRTDWNSLLSDEGAPLFTAVTPRYFPPADAMVDYLADFAATHRLRIRYNTRITRISRPTADAGTGDSAAPRGDFAVHTADGTVLRAKRLIMATGVSRPYIPPIDGVELAERYDEVSVDPEDFTDQRVLIIGRGNSAFETADNLIETTAVIHMVGPGSLRLAWQTHFVGHLRAVNNNFLDTYQLKSQNALLDGEVLSIRRTGEDGPYRVAVKFSRVAEVVKEISYDRVILATGFRFDAGVFAEECRPELTIKDRFPAQTDAWESTNVPDLYFAGTITQVRDFKRSTSGFIHGFRYGVRALDRILARRYHGEPWPATPLAAAPEAVADAVLARVNRSSALWQLFAFLGDAVLVGTETLGYYEELPIDHLHRALGEGGFGPVDRYLTVTLEYGADHDKVNPFDITVNRLSQQDTGGLDSRYLHPVVRLWQDGKTLSEHHITENLENEWDSEQVHRAPLVRFLATHLFPASHPAAAGPS